MEEDLEAKLAKKEMSLQLGNECVKPSVKEYFSKYK